jgi:hypothetical protein
MEATNTYAHVDTHKRERPPGGDGAFRIPTLAGPTQHTHTHTLGGKKKKEPFFLPSRMEIGMQKQRLGAKDKI